MMLKDGLFLIVHCGIMLVVVCHDAAFGFDGSNSDRTVRTPAQPVSRKLQWSRLCQCRQQMYDHSVVQVWSQELLLL